MSKDKLLWFAVADIVLAVIAYGFNWNWVCLASLSAAVINTARAADWRVILARLLIAIGHGACTINQGLVVLHDCLKWFAIKMVNAAAMLTGCERYEVRVSDSTHG